MSAASHAPSPRCSWSPPAMSSASLAPVPAPGNVRMKLFVMMVLQFFIWGAWLPLIFGYLPGLNFTPGEQAWILNAFPIAAIVGLFFSNQFADRNFAAERFVGASHLIGGLAMIGLFWVPAHEVLGSNPDGSRIVAAYDLRSFWPFFGLMLVH